MYSCKCTCYTQISRGEGGGGVAEFSCDISLITKHNCEEDYVISDEKKVTATMSYWPVCREWKNKRNVETLVYNTVAGILTSYRDPVPAITIVT